MEKYVAARRLRRNYVENKENETQEKHSNSFMFRSILSSVLIITLYCVHQYCPEVVHNNKILKGIYDEYKRDYKLSDIKQKIKNIVIYEEEALLENKQDNITKNVEVVPVSNTNKIEVSSLNEMNILKEKINKNIEFVVPTSGVITSRYGVRNSNNIITPYHTGIDIANKKGTKINSSTDGIVVATYNDKYYGNTIEIVNENIKIRYAHLDKINVKKEDKIKKGDYIGDMGSSGNSTGPHLHFEIIVDNIQVNPEEIINEFAKDQI